MTIRDRMTTNERENLDWCKPFVSNDGKIAVAINDGGIESIVDNGDEFINPTPEQIESVTKRLLGGEYALHKGHSNEYLLITTLKETGCANCPWFGVCEAMDDVIEEV